MPGATKGRIQACLHIICFGSSPSPTQSRRGSVCLMRGGHQKQRLELWEMSEDRIEQKQSCAEWRCCRAANSRCMFTLMKLPLFSVMTTMEGPLSSLIPTQALVGLSPICLAYDQKCLTSVSASGATVDELSSFKYRGCLNASPIATAADIIVTLCSWELQALGSNKPLSKPSPTISQLIHRLTD